MIDHTSKIKMWFNGKVHLSDWYADFQEWILCQIWSLDPTLSLWLSPHIAISLSIFFTHLTPNQPVEKPQVPIDSDCGLVH